MDDYEFPKPFAYHRFCGYLVVFNRADNEGEVVKPGAYSAALKRGLFRPLTLLFNHDKDHPMGIITSLEEDSFGIKIQGQIWVREQALIQKIISGALTGLSMGFHDHGGRWRLSLFSKAPQHRRKCLSQGWRNLWGLFYREIHVLELCEGSVVPFPSNFHARIHWIDPKKIQPENRTRVLSSEVLVPLDLTSKLISPSL